MRDDYEVSTGVLSAAGAAITALTPSVAAVESGIKTQRLPGAEITVAAEPVSYTHLDVYKRQA